MNRARKIVLVIYLFVMAGIGIYVPWQWKYGPDRTPGNLGYHLFFTPTVWRLRGEPNFAVIFLEVLAATSLCGIGILLTTRGLSAKKEGK